MKQNHSFAEGGLLLETGAIAKLTLSRPSVRNALTHAMWDGLAEAAAILAAESSARVLIVSGAGGKAFSAGADIAEFPATYATPETTAAYNSSVRNAQLAISTLSIPVIAKVQGACFGGGCGLALHCDLRFAAASARFAITPAKLGLAYSFADTARLVSLVGPSRAKDILMSGRTLSAAEAYDIGMLDRVFDDDELDAAVTDYAEGLSELSSESIRIAKATIDEVAQGRIEPTDQLRRDFERTFSGMDFAEGYKAFMEKRKPNFQKP